MQRRRVFLGALAVVPAPAFVRTQGPLHKFKFNLGWKVEATVPFGLKTTPAVGDVWTDRFLPVPANRRIAA